jgi:uncharacterized protein (DUF58 family)
MSASTLAVSPPPAPSVAPLAVPAGPPPLRIPRAGVYWILAAAVLIGIGTLKGINLLTLLGCILLVVWSLNLFLAGRGLRRLRGQRRVGGFVFAGTPAPVSFQAELDGRGPLRGVVLEDQGPEHRLARFVAALPGQRALRWRGEVVVPTRGRYAWGPLVARSSYPFGLVERQALLVPGTEQLVLPRLGTLDRVGLRRYLAPVGLRREPDRRLGRRHPTAQAEFHGLRAFRSGDSPRWIHWRTSARCNELMVREFEDVPSDDLILVLDPAVTDPGRPSPALEAVVSLAATVCWERCRQKGDRLILVVVGARPVVLDGLTGPEHARRLLEALAVVEAEPPGTALDRGAKLSGLHLPAAPVLLLSAGPSDLGGPVGRLLERPVAALTAKDLPRLDFYTGPSPDGRPEGGTVHAS